MALIFLRSLIFNILFYVVFLFWSLVALPTFVMPRSAMLKVAGWWAAFVELHTSGHAQLVHARVATLEAKGFPTPTWKA